MKKIISVGFIPLSNLSGITTFNKSLEKVFGDNIVFVNFYSNKSSESIHNELTLGFSKGLLFKTLNYMSNYNISASYMSDFILDMNVSENDVLILNSPSFLRKKLPKSRKILIMHQDMKTMMRNRSNFSNSKKFLNYVNTQIDYFIVPTESDRDFSIRIFGFDPKKVSVIPHISKAPLILQRKVFSKNIAMITRLDNKQKAIDKVIKAMKKIPDWNLNIYGDGQDKNKLLSLVLKEKIKNVIFHGRVDDVSEALDNNSIHVMSSNFEGFGLTNIEALSRCLPLIIRNTYPAAKDILSFDNGLLISKEWDDEEFVQAILKISNEYFFYSENAIKSAANYKLEYVREKWLDLIK